MWGMKPMLRRGTAAGALLSIGLALFGCGNPSPSPTGDSSIIVSPNSPESGASTQASEGSAPDLRGFELLFSARQHLASSPEPASSPGDSITSPAFDGVLANSDYVAVYSNDLLAKTYEITGYRISSGAQEWSHEGNGILSCRDSDIVVCETKSYTDGVWTTEAAWLFSLDIGGFRALDVGSAGTFSYVGDNDDVAYFLTWDGTRSIHVTGFDESGVPVVDKNLKVKAPSPAKNVDPETWMNGSHALIDYPGETPILYDAAHNLATEVDVAAPCISVRNGAVCMSSQAPGTIIGMNDRMRESWRHTTTAVSLLDTASEDVTLEDVKNLFLTSQPTATQIPDPDIVPGPGHPTPGATAVATPGTLPAQLAVVIVDAATSGISATAGEKPAPRPTSDSDVPAGLEKLYATVAGQDAVLLALAEGMLSLPGERVVALGGQEVESVDLSEEVAIVNVSAADPSPGESGPTRVFSSILVGKDGRVLSALPSDRIAKLFEQSDAAGQQIAAHTFTWKNDYLIFADASRGVVAVYEQK